MISGVVISGELGLSALAVGVLGVARYGESSRTDGGLVGSNVNFVIIELAHNPNVDFLFEPTVWIEARGDARSETHPGRSIEEVDAAGIDGDVDLLSRAHGRAGVEGADEARFKYRAHLQI